MQSVCRLLREADSDPDLAGLVQDALPSWRPDAYLGQDRITRGDWELAYGRESYVLAAMGQLTDWFGGSMAVRYSLAIPGGRDRPRHWLSSSFRAIPDPRALLMPAAWKKLVAAEGPFPAEWFGKSICPKATVRRAAWWDDHGEQHAFDELGPDLLVNIDIPPGEHQLSFYCLDPDWYHTRRPRQQSVLLVDAQRQVLAASWTGKFGRGIYERFAVSGPGQVTARFFKHRSACVAVSGFFLDPLPVANPDDPDDANSAEVAEVIRLIKQNAEPRQVYQAACRFFEHAPEMVDAQLRPALEEILNECTQHTFYPIREWALRLWKEKEFPDTPLSQHAERMLASVSR